VGAFASVAVPEVSAESAVSDVSAAFAEVSVSGAGTAASVVVPEASAASPVGAFASVAVPEVSAESAVSDVSAAASIEADGARTSARAVWTNNDAQPRAASSAAVQPRTRSHRWSAKTATRFGSNSAPLAMAAVVLRASEYRS
jgi:hypothetical protein